jgi:hypothetical protein
MTSKIAGSGAGNIAWYETTVSTGGSAVTPLNHNRNSANAPAIDVVESCTLTTTGTLFGPDRFGSGQVAGGQARADNEWILAQNTKYAFVIRSEAASNKVAGTLSFYELGGN